MQVIKTFSLPISVGILNVKKLLNISYFDVLCLTVTSFTAEAIGWHSGLSGQLVM